MATADKLNKLLNTKAAIKQAIIDKGVEVPDGTIFADYPAKINAIEVGGGDDSTYLNPDFYEIRTSGGTNYKGLFAYYYNSKVGTLDVSNFDTSNVTNMAYMFSNCQILTAIDGLSNFDTSNVTDMGSMFYYCTSLTSLDVSNFDTSNVTNMSYMFYNCSKLTSLDVSNFDASNAKDISSMFYGCSKLTSLDVSNFDTSNVTNMNNMFSGCSKLTSLDLSNFDVSKVTASYSVSYTFNGCTALTDFKAPKNISAPFDFSPCTNLTHDSLMSIINNLITVTSTKKLTLGATNLAKLNAEEIAIAANKGWTLS